MRLLLRACVLFLDGSPDDFSCKPSAEKADESPEDDADKDVSEIMLADKNPAYADHKGPEEDPDGVSCILLPYVIAESHAGAYGKSECI